MSVTILASQYTQFQNSFGQGEAQNYAEAAGLLFSHDFKKIANGQEQVSNLTMLLPQLETVKGFAGNWTIKNQETIPSQDNTKCTIKYSLDSQKAGRFEAIAILTIADNKIKEIDEIFYQCASL